MMDKNNISFKRLQLDDLQLIHKWLNEPHVHEWYEKDKENTLEEVKASFGPEISGEKPTVGYLISYENNPIGYIQYCKVNDYPEYGPYLGYDDNTANVDLFIGDIKFTGKGLGSMILRKFIKEILFTKDDIMTCLIDPEPTNIRAIKSYEKAGFKYVKTVQIPVEPEPSYVMELKKENF